MSATAVCPEPIQLHAERSLHQLLTRAHEDAQAYGNTECPVCGGEMAPQGSVAECDDCGSRLG